MTASAPLFDSHAHLDEPSLVTDRKDVFSLCEENHVVGVLTIGTTLQSSRDSIQLAQEQDFVHAAIGIHPNYVSQASEDDWEKIVALAEDENVVAIGETGLDRYWDHAPIELQIDYFQRHLNLSRELQKPFIVHCRDAEEDVLQVLAADAEKGPLQGIMHSFCGSGAMAKQCLEWGMYLSFSGMLTFKRNVELRELAATVPQDRVLIETDAL